MMNKSETLAFAASSAATAIDQRDAYADAVGSYRDNVVDTLNDEGAAEWVAEALEVFDAEVAKLLCA